MLLSYKKLLSVKIDYRCQKSINLSKGLAKKFRQAKPFYIILALATLIGALFNFFYF